MVPFTYFRPSDLAEASKALGATQGSKIIAGGTNLVDLMKYNVERPTQVIDITQVRGIGDVVDNDDGGLRIGALVRNSDLAYHKRVARRYPLLSSALLHGASAQLRNAATTGGNLMQRTRCYYFYDTATACNKRTPGAGCSAIGGVNRIHAVLGTSDQCIATNPSDMNVALAALEARVLVTGAGGERVIPMAAFHRLPGEHPERDTTLAPDEVIYGVDLPAEGYAANYTYLKLRDRHSYAFALVSVAVGMSLKGGRISAARIALGGVAHKPWRVPEAEAMLEGEAPGDGLFGAVAARMMQGAVAQSSNGFKIELGRRAILRALAQAAAGTPQAVADKHVA
jgi:xanthine dehydrogenase YagS FAD-binding subunit